MRGFGLALILPLALATGAAAQDGAPDAVQPPADLPSQTIRTPANAPPLGVSAIVTVDQDLLFTNSDWGKRTQRVLDEEEAKIEAENERLVNELSTEEAALTQQRGTLDPALTAKIKQAFLALDPANPEHKAILDLQAASRFIDTKPENYKGIEDAARAADLLK